MYGETWVGWSVIRLLMVINMKHLRHLYINKHMDLRRRLVEGDSQTNWKT